MTGPSDFDTHDDQFRAVCVLIQLPNSKILAVTRGSNLTALGLPGGSCKLGENIRDAAIRELFEETGLVLIDPSPIYDGDFDGRHVWAFSGSFRGTIQHSDEGQVVEATPEEILAGPFGDYNRRIFEAIGLV